MLRRAWDLANDLLVVSARLQGDRKGDEFEEFRDGYMTRLGTFQKFFQQSELRSWIAETLEEQPVPAAPGVFYVFRVRTAREQFLARRYRRISAPPRVRQSERLFEEHRELFEALSRFLTKRGRLPAEWELEKAAMLSAAIGSLPRAFLVLRRVMGEEQWEHIAQERAQDLLVYLALSRFDGRPRFSLLPGDLQLDVRAFFASYKNACEKADALLFSAGNLDEVNVCCDESAVGKKTPNALYAHITALPLLPPLLRVYEGCARSYVGRVEGATIVKLNRKKPMVSYLAYPDFDKNPHPSLHASLIADLQSLTVRQQDYFSSPNPPVLHRKELLVGPDYPGRDKFQRLTAQEDRNGLLKSSHAIGTYRGWSSQLEAMGFLLRGHRLVRMDTASLLSGDF